MRTMAGVLQAAPIALVALGACRSPGAPPSYNAGSWTLGFAVPSGAYTQFSLDTVAGLVRGDGQDFGLAGRPLATIKVSGVESYPSIALVFDYSSGERATYFAQFVGPSELLGTWSVPGQPPIDSLSSRQ